MNASKNLHRACKPAARVLLACGVAALLCPLPPAAAGEQARRIKRVPVAEVPAGALPEGLDVDLPERAVCEEMTRRIADAYGTPEMERYLHEDFPNATELLDALQRADTRVTNIELSIDSIESVRIQPWQLLETEEREDATVHTIFSDCVVDLQVRALFDTTEGRTVTDASRSEWRVRLTRKVSDVRGEA